MRTLRRAAVLVVLAAMVGATGHARPSIANAGPITHQQAAPPERVGWLAAGDSYSSGEGIASTGTGDDRCAQSPLAYGPRAVDILRSQRSWNVDPLAFVACTGATLHEFYSGGNEANNGFGPQWDQAVRSNPSGGRFDVVTMSFGGNDIGFEDVVKGCLGPTAAALTWGSLVTGEAVGDTLCDDTADELRRRIDDLLAGRSWAHPDLPFVTDAPGTLADFFVDVATRTVSDRGALVVVGYPQLFAPVTEWGDWRGGRCNVISRAGADMLNQLAAEFDQALRNAVSEAQAYAGLDRVIYISRYDLFHSHELCSGGTEYLNGLSLGFRDGSGRPAHSFHPNEIGHLVTAEVVAGEVAYRLDPPAPPTADTAQPSSATPTPITDGASHFDIGDHFVASCVVAWPTAPVRTTTAIHMRMSCPGVPQQFLFVDVIYADPDLPVTPSTGYMQVEGTIVDVATSEYGFRTLVVEASQVILP